MADSASATVKDGGSSLSLRFDACRVFPGGEQAGNIELDLACDASQVARALECLRLQVPGAPPTAEALAHGPHAGGVRLVFWTEPANLNGHASGPVEILWGDTPVAEIACRVSEAAPIGEHVRYLEPSEILQTLPVATSRHVLLAARKESWWLVVGALEGLCGVAVAAALPAAEVSPIVAWAVGGAMVLNGLAIAFLLGTAPKSQVWLDRDRRRVLLIEGRTRDPQSRFADAPSRGLDGFHHVRLFQRWQLSGNDESEAQAVWFVTLEPEIEFAGDDGRVHLHDEALELAHFGSETAARHCAAVVAFHTGLSILDTGHDGTA